jgi:hypothetical protein
MSECGCSGLFRTGVRLHQSAQALGRITHGARLGEHGEVRKAIAVVDEMHPAEGTIECLPFLVAQARKRLQSRKRGRRLVTNDVTVVEQGARSC